MSFLDVGSQRALRQRLDALPHAVRLVTWTQALNCQFCQDTERLLAALQGIALDKVHETAYLTTGRWFGASAYSKGLRRAPAEIHKLGAIAAAEEMVLRLKEGEKNEH